MRIKFNQLNFSKFIFILIILISLFFVSNFNKGLETSDESYILLYSLYPDEIIGKLTNFGIISNKILYLLNYNLFFFRIFGFCLLIFSSFTLVESLFFFYKSLSFKLFFDKYLIYSMTLVGVICFYRFWN